MIYLIDGKPYIKVSGHYKMVEIKKSGNEYIVIPVGDKSNRIEVSIAKNVSSISIEEYMKNKARKKLESEENN